MSSDQEGGPAATNTTSLMPGKLATSGQMPSGFVGDGPVSESFRSELVRILQIELQIIGQKIARETCREITRCMDRKAGSSLSSRSPSRGRKADGSPKAGRRQLSKDTFTEFYQRHRIQGAANSALGRLRENDLLETPDDPPGPPQCIAGMPMVVVRTQESDEGGVGNGEDFPTPPPTVPGCIEPTFPPSKPPSLEDRAPSKDSLFRSESPKGRTSARFTQDPILRRESSPGRSSIRSFADEGFGVGPENNNPTENWRRRSTIRTRKTRKAFIFADTSNVPGGVGDFVHHVDSVNWVDPIYLRTRLVRFIQGDEFDYMMGSFLALNAFFMGAQTQVMTQDTKEPSVLQTFDIIDWIFACIFLSEVIIRIVVNGKAFFCDKWNVSDIFIVALHFTELITKAAASVSNGMVDNLGMLRMLRLGRLARMVRMVRLIPELKSMVYLMTASMGSFVWAVFLMVVVMYAFAIYFTEISIDIKQARPEHAETISNTWGAIWRSMLSLYMAISGGDDWEKLMLPLTYTQPEYAIMNQLIFSVYIAFSTLVMLNLVTGVFVEGAQRIIRDEQDNEVLRMASKAFLHADADMSSEITWEEYNGILNSEQMGDYCAAVGITLPEAYDLFEILDVDKSSSLSVNEFVKGCLKLRGQCTRMDVAQFRFKVETDMELIKLEVEDMHAVLQKLMRNSEGKKIEPETDKGTGGGAVSDGSESRHMEEEV
eukprot:TRINITY_DN27279_c0_g1_i1.p1 TRINITY_DN27279_c0_g1~~TRINITY_DN27279_c0_g1_i1.p1  ORF type:complete len:713 (+),score=119.24 TRINITY_DN27279_c0_g1_i1:84-2222(+)